MCTRQNGFHSRHTSARAPFFCVYFNFRDWSSSVCLFIFFLSPTVIAREVRCYGFFFQSASHYLQTRLPRSHPCDDSAAENKVGHYLFVYLLRSMFKGSCHPSWSSLLRLTACSQRHKGGDSFSLRFKQPGTSGSRNIANRITFFCHRKSE